jgi:hypothetical protein
MPNVFLLCSLQETTMDWDLAIKRNSEALKDIVEALFAMLGLALTDAAARLPWPAYRAVLRVLRPAESAQRRLIFIAARGLVVKPALPRCKPAGPVKAKKGLRQRAAAFQLFDPRTRIMLPRRRAPARVSPRLHIFTADNELVTLWPPPRPATSSAPAALPPSDGLVTAERLIRRLQALETALGDLPRQARRLARWRVRQERAPSPSFKSPIRPGHPPGHRRRKIHDVDDLLSECHGLACYAMMPDTS